MIPWDCSISCWMSWLADGFGESFVIMTGRKIVTAGGVVRLLLFWGRFWPILLSSEAKAQQDISIYPRGTNLTSLWVLPAAHFGSEAEQVMVATLQGVVARKSSEQIYLEGNGGYPIWKAHLQQAYGIPWTNVPSPWSLLRRFKDRINGYVLYDAARLPDSLNAANSLAGVQDGIAVDISLESQVRAYGVTNRLFDARSLTAPMVWTNFTSRFNPAIVVEQRSSIAANLRDYAAMAHAFTFFDGNSVFRSKVVSGLTPDAACLGWGDASQGENVFVGDGSRHGVHTIAADWALNLSTLSSVRDDGLFQPKPSLASFNTNGHTVTFLATDGDNVQWILGGFPAYYNHPARGSFDMGWAMPPALAELAPSAMRWYYEQSSVSPHRDYFVAGVSGDGYFYPSLYPASALAVQVANLGKLMDLADLRIVQILDFNSVRRMDLWNSYLSQPNIEALFYLEYAPYSGANGLIQLATNGCPVIAARDMLWPGLEDAPQLIGHLNSYSQDSSSPEAYSLVPVLVWGTSIGSMGQVVSNLAPQVQAVAPDVFVRRIRDRVARCLTYGWDMGLQGWEGGSSGKPYDKALWKVDVGNAGGGLLLDGSDLGHPDGNPNSWFSRQISLPANASSLSFDTRANHDGQLRVRLLDAAGHLQVLLDWEKLSRPNQWVHRVVSLSAFAGQTVTLFLEQNDGGAGSGEYRYIDNLMVMTTEKPAFRPAPPRIIELKCQQGVQISWSDRDSEEAGFRLERQSNVDGHWVEIAAVSTHVTTFQDSAVTPGVRYQYRIRSWNAAGSSEPSPTRSIAVPPRPHLTVQFRQGQMEVSWPAPFSSGSLHTSLALAPETVWSPVPYDPLETNGSWVIRMPMESSTQFLQLR